MRISASTVAQDEAVAVRGSGFEPGESVAATQYSTPRSLGTQVADGNGDVAFTWTLRADEATGTHRVVLSGERSGSVELTFQVVAADANELPATGSATAAITLMAALAACLGGAVLAMGAAHRAATSHEPQDRRDT